MLHKIISHLSPSRNVANKCSLKAHQLEDEICRLKNEAIQVPILKAKLDILENQLKAVKQKQSSESKEAVNKLENFHDKTLSDEKLVGDEKPSDEKPSDENSDADSVSSLFNSEASWANFVKQLGNDTKVDETSLIPPRSHKRGESTSTAQSSEKSIFSVMQHETSRSNTELDMSLAYEEANIAILEKLKLREMENTKLSNQVAILESQIGDLRVITNEPSIKISLDPLKREYLGGNKSRISLSINIEELADSGAQVEHDTINVSSPSSIYSPASDYPVTSFEARITRNEFYNKTLRRKSSADSLLSLNKSIKSKAHYYLIDENEQDYSVDQLVPHKKRASLINYCQNVTHKISPRPKSVAYF